MPASKPAPKATVLILGTKYCGSTLLGTALGRHPEIAHAGEIAYLPAYFRALTGTPPERPPTCLSCAFGGRACATWTPDVMARCEEAGAEGVHDFLRDLLGKPVVVDGSKRIDWLKHHLLGRPRRVPKVIISARHPGAYAASARMYDGVPAAVAAATWRDTYWEALTLCSALNLDPIVVRHEDFMAWRGPTALRLCHFLGVEPVAAMASADYPPACALGGNPGVAAASSGHDEARFAIPFHLHPVHRERTGHGVLDSRWKADLPPEELEMISRTQGVGDVAALLGYNPATLFSHADLPAKA